MSKIMDEIIQEEVREVAIRTTVETYFELGQSFSAVVAALIRKFSLSPDEAEGKARQYGAWN